MVLSEPVRKMLDQPLIGRISVIDEEGYPHSAQLDFIDNQVEKRYLAAERRKAYEERQTPPCDTHTCHTCGAC